MTMDFMGHLRSDDGRQQRLTGKMRRQIVAHQLAHCLTRFHRAADA